LGCVSPVLNAVNRTFGTSFSKFSDLFTQGGGVNLIISAGSQFSQVGLGRYPLNWFSNLIGYGPTLHIVGSGPLDPKAVWDPTNGIFTAHLDSAFAYNPIGALLHLLIDVLGIGRTPCPT
jgi:hypothetical protein